MRRVLRTSCSRARARASCAGTRQSRTGTRPHLRVETDLRRGVGSGMQSLPLGWAAATCAASAASCRHARVVGSDWRERLRGDSVFMWLGHSVISPRAFLASGRGSHRRFQRVRAASGPRRTGTHGRDPPPKGCSSMRCSRGRRLRRLVLGPLQACERGDGAAPNRGSLFRDSRVNAHRLSRERLRQERPPPAAAVSPLLLLRQRRAQRAAGHFAASADRIATLFEHLVFSQMRALAAARDVDMTISSYRTEHGSEGGFHRGERKDIVGGRMQSLAPGGPRRFARPRQLHRDRRAPVSRDRRLSGRRSPGDRGGGRPPLAAVLAGARRGHRVGPHSPRGLPSARGGSGIAFGFER